MYITQKHRFPVQNIKGTTAVVLKPYHEKKKIIKKNSNVLKDFAARYAFLFYKLVEIRFGDVWSVISLRFTYNYKNKPIWTSLTL